MSRLTPIARFIRPDTPEEEKADILREMTEKINALMGAYGPIQPLSDIDMQSKRIRNLGAAKASSDAITQTGTDPLYGPSVQQATAEAVGKNMLQTTRRLNDPNQQHKISSDLRRQGSIPPVVVGTFSFTSTGININWTWPGLQLQYADLTTVQPSNTSFNVTGLSNGTQYKFYPYYDTSTGLMQFVVDIVNGSGTPQVAFNVSAVTNTTLQNALQLENMDGRIPCTISGMTATPSIGGSGSGKGGSGCIHQRMLVMAQSGAYFPIIETRVGQFIQCRGGKLTQVLAKYVAPESSWIRVRGSHGDHLLVTPSQPLARWEDADIEAAKLTLADILCGETFRREEVTVQIKELAPVTEQAHSVLLRCEPYHDFLVGSYRPSFVAHNYTPAK